MAVDDAEHQLVSEWFSAACAPVVLAFSDRRLVAVVVPTIEHGLVAKIEATADPSER